MNGPLVVVFLAIIALTALLQAGFVGALAYAARRGGRKLDEFEGTFDDMVAPQIRHAARLTDKAAQLTEKTLGQARRVEEGVDQASRKAERYVDEAAVGVEDAVERTVDRVSMHVAARAARAKESRLGRNLSTAAAVARGVQRALEVWEASAEEDDRMHPDGGGADDADPPGPSPA